MCNFINNIPPTNLDSWFRGLTILTIALPIVGAILGGVCGWGAFVVNTRIANLQIAQLVQAKQAADTANEELEKIRTRDTPHHLDEPQKHKLAQFLADKPKGQLIIKINITAFDARSYADEIGKFLQESCGWSVRLDNALITGSNTTGAWFSIKDSNHVPSITAIIHSAFVYSGIPIRKTIDVDAGVPTDTEVWLSIGAKE